MAAGRGENNVEQRKSNARLAWILASAAIVFALGFVAKIWLFSH
jgi:hypothetical protein